MNIYYCETCGVRISDAPTGLPPGDERGRLCPEHRLPAARQATAPAVAPASRKTSGMIVPTPSASPSSSTIPPASPPRGNSAARLRPLKPSGVHPTAAPAARAAAASKGGINPQIAVVAVIGSALFLAFALFHGSGSTKSDATSRPGSTGTSDKITAVTPNPVVPNVQTPHAPVLEKTPVERTKPVPTAVANPPAISTTRSSSTAKPEIAATKPASDTAAPPDNATTAPAQSMGFMSGDLGDIREEAAARRLDEITAALKDGKLNERELRAEYKKFLVSNASTKAGHVVEKLLKDLPPPAVYAIEGPKDGLLACWSFKGAGKEIEDRSGRELDGELDGATRTNDTPVALSFDGNGNAVKISNVFGGVSANFTMSCWAKPNAPRAATVESLNGAIGVRDQRYAIFPTQGDGAYGHGHAGSGLSIGTNGIAIFEHSEGYLPSVLVYDAPVNDWVHVVAVYEKNKPTLYVNGVAVKQGSTSPLTTHPGAGLGGNSYGWYRGLLGEVRIYNRALAANEVKALFELGRR